MSTRFTAILVLFTPGLILANVYSWEANVFPEAAGWDVINRYCGIEEWVENGNFLEHVDICETHPPPGGQQSDYRQSLSQYKSTQDLFFCEWKMETDGNRDQIPFGAPATFVCDGDSVNYRFSMASDQAKLNRDNTLPITYVDIEPGVPHVYRLELDTDQWYRWYIDDMIADEGVPEGAYPSGFAPDANFRAKYYTSASTSEWHYIRWGEQPVDASGDFDTNGEIDNYDLYFFDECATNALMLPGCRWADMDSDTDVDCDDWTLFQLAWTGAGDPPTPSACLVVDPIPTVSTWGLLVLGLLTLTSGTLVFRQSPNGWCVPRRAFRRG